MTALLAAERIVKRFPGVVALKGVTFDVRPGEIHALCGENGAGKSTLIKVLGGLHPRGTYEGRLLASGRRAEFASPRDAEKAGIAVIHQELALVPALSAAENIFLGAEPVRGGLIDGEELLRRARALLDGFGLASEAETPVERLGMGRRQLVEIVKALRKDSKVLILDEPTAALGEAETEVLLEKLKELRRRGLGLVYISHKLEEVFALADRITVLRDGESVATLPAERASRREIIRLMVGREIKDLFPRRSVEPGPVLLKVEGLSAAPPGRREAFLKRVSFEVRAGEVLGIGGLMGSGRTELLMHLIGAWGSRLEGRVALEGRDAGAPGPGEALGLGLGLVSEDRRRWGLVLGQPVSFNLSLSSLGRLTRRGLIDRERERAECRRLSDALRVKPRGLEAAAGGLSGGNQQKVVIGKVLMTGPRVVLLDEPTRGIDVGAKLEVYEIVNRLTEEGKAVVLVSSELPELMGMSDRIVMLRAGQVAGAYTRREATAERLMAAALGAEAHA